MPKYLVFSDLHFGNPNCSLHQPEFTQNFLQTLQEQIEPSPIFGNPTVSEVIFLGDTLDLEQCSIRDFAQEHENSFGSAFRNFLAQLDECLSPTRYIYVIGNADYELLQIHEHIRLSKDIWKSTVPSEPNPLLYLDEVDSFLKSFFPIGVEVVVKYPAHWIDLQNFEEYIVLTHGHHFDAGQSLGKKLNRVPKPNSSKTFQQLGGTDYYNRLAHEHYIAKSHHFYASLQIQEKGFWSRFFQDWYHPKQTLIPFDYLRIFIKFFSSASGHLRSVAPCRALIHGHLQVSMLTQQKGILLGSPGHALLDDKKQPQIGCLLITDWVEEGKIQFRLFQFQPTSESTVYPLKGKTIEVLPGQKNWLGETVHYQRFWGLQIFHYVFRFFYFLCFYFFSSKRDFS